MKITATTDDGQLVAVWEVDESDPDRKITLLSVLNLIGESINPDEDEKKEITPQEKLSLQESLEARERRSYVMEHMHRHGVFQLKLTEMQWMEVYLLGDGFGCVDKEWAQQQGWDWSHIRDSSLAAIDRMYDKIKEFVGDEN